MKIINSVVEIEKVNELSSEYFEAEFKKRSLNVIRWAIVESQRDKFIVNVSCVEN